MQLLLSRRSGNCDDILHYLASYLKSSIYFIILSKVILNETSHSDFTKPTDVILCKINYENINLIEIS
jgi:hypothetical protein